MADAAPRAGQDWTSSERSDALDVYFDMYALEQREQKYTRTRFYQAFVALHPQRTVKALEYKLQNVSACLLEMGFAPLRGMAPAFNYQRVLLPEAATRVGSLEALLVETAGAAPAVPCAAVPSRIVQPPSVVRSKWIELARAEPIARRIDFVALEQSNRKLGLAGEEWVVELERKTLHDAGAPELAKKVCHAAIEQGDGLGYDISSFDAQTGAERLIEVKTTRSGILMPFMLSRNEVRVSDQRHDAFVLYRVHDFGRAAAVFKLPGALELSCELTPLSFRATPRAASA